MRLLDLDLDFFVHGVAHWRGREHDRLDPDEYPAWSVDDAIAFLRGQCGLSGPLPGVTVEHHADLFFEWRDAIGAGFLASPFSVTHVDAHADLGLGDAGYVYLMTDLLFRDVPDRTNPEVGPRKLRDGNFLAFAIGCRWISELVYIYNQGGGNDLLYYHMEDFDLQSTNIELKAVRAEDLRRAVGPRRPEVVRREPQVPFAQIRWDSFTADEPFDAVFLARSPAFTPESADAVFEAIRAEFMDETAWPRAISL